MRTLSSRLLLAAALLSPAGCSSGDAPPSDRRSGAGMEAADRPPEQRPPAPVAALDPQSTCGRAFACCQAFAEAIPTVSAASACAGPAEEAAGGHAEARCRSMIAGWREALELHAEAEPPEACR